MNAKLMDDENDLGFESLEFMADEIKYRFKTDQPITTEMIFRHCMLCNFIIHSTTSDQMKVYAHEILESLFSMDIKELSNGKT